MKSKAVKFIHQLIVFVRLDEVFVFLSRFIPFFIRFIPLQTNYKNPTLRIVKRNKAWFKLQINDYMQWHIWAGCVDISWKLASKHNKGTIIDIGANVGGFAIKVLANTTSTEIYAFEPNLRITKILEQNYLLNPQIKNRLNIQTYALSNSDGVSNLVINSLNSGASVLSNSAESKEVMQVKTITLDNFIKRNKINDIKFVKIDVEGFEPQVIEGAVNIIKQFKPDFYIEVTPKWWKKNGYNVNQVLVLFENLGYEFYPVTNEKSCRFSRDTLTNICKIEQQFNLYLLHRQ